MYFFLDESPQYLIFKAESQDIQSEQDMYIPRGVGYIREVTNRAVGNLKTIRRELGLGSMLSLFGMMAYWIVFSWAPKYLGEIGLSPHQIGYWMLLSQAGAFIGYVSFGFIADHTGRIKITFASYALVFAVGIFIFTSTSGAGATSILPLIGIFVTGLGTGFFSGYGPIYSKLFPIKVRNTSASFCFNSGRLGAFVAPILVAQLAVYFGFAFAMSLASIFALLLAGWVFLIPISEWAETRYKKPLEEKPIVVKIK
jgi:MFS family permease